MQIAKSKAEQFVQGVKLLSASILELANLVVEAVDEDPRFIDRVQELQPDLSEALLLRFYRVGRGALVEPLLFDDSPAGRRLQKLPYHVQQKYTEEPLPVLVRNGDQWDELKVDFRNATGKQAHQVVAGNTVRSIAEQRAWLESRRTLPPVEIPDPYRVVNGSLVVKQPCRLSRRQLLDALSSMG